MPERIRSLVDHGHVDPQARQRQGEGRFEAAEIERLGHGRVRFPEQQRVLDKLLGDDHRRPAAAERIGAGEAHPMPQPSDEPLPESRSGEIRQNDLVPGMQHGITRLAYIETVRQVTLGRHVPRPMNRWFGAESRCGGEPSRRRQHALRRRPVVAVATHARPAL